MLIYDLEIKKAILGKNEQPLQDIEYCKGWSDFREMGISVAGCYDYREDRYRVFMDDNLPAFQSLVNDREVIVGFNSLSFDNKLCESNSLAVPGEKSYDVLAEVWKAAGLSPTFSYPSHIGFGLDACVAANFPGFKKSGHGAMAPVQWQKGRIGSVVDYCLNDVKITKMLLDKILLTGHLRDPRNPSNILAIAGPRRKTVRRGPDAGSSGFKEEAKEE